jgi:TPR repeat protein
MVRRQEWFVAALISVVACISVAGAQDAQTKPDVIELLQRATSGDAAAQSDLGWAYYTGNGLPEDPGEAVAWLRKSAAQGNASGQNRLGVAYYEGKGVPKDGKEAVAWYRRAAEQGLLQAQLNLAWTYNFGLGVARDYAEAAIWYRKAAEQGDAQAQADLGVAYRNGEGVKKDTREAEQWLIKASEQGYAVATHRIAALYWNGEFRGGRDTLRSLVAIDHFKKAAAQGYPLSALNLAEIYASRNPYVRRDYQASCMWTVIADGLLRRGAWDRRQPEATADLRRKLPDLTARVRKDLTEQQVDVCEQQGAQWLTANAEPSH